MISCILVDDEQHCVDTLSVILKARFSDILTVTATATDGRLAHSLIIKHSPDILFLDVEMPHLNGIEIINSLPNRSCEIVFVTAYEKYALNAIKSNACDYLLKPISLPELSMSIQKCAERIRDRKAKFLQTPPIKKLSLTVAKGVTFVDISDIIRVESDNNYCLFHLTNRPKILVAKTLKEYEERLTGCNFFRVHHSHLVNLSFVESYQSTPAEDFLLLSNKEKIEVSRRRKAAFLERLSSL